MKKIETEGAVKDLVLQWFKQRGGFSYAPIQNGMGIHGVHDRVGVLPVIVTPEMVGKKIGLFVSVECKKPGRRNERDRGMSKHQVLFMEDAQKAGGLSVCVDGHEDLDNLESTLRQLGEL